jgi:3-hydroxyanthranilate 3,4-dioxygenase
MVRKRAFNIFQQAQDAGPYDEYPVLPPDIDPQLHLSRNDRPQPFYLVCEHDCLIAQMAGRATVQFKNSNIMQFALTIGDFLYVPAGTPHRILPETESIQVRYKARDAGWEGAGWYCEKCGAELWRSEWNTADQLPQEGYWLACRAFNEDSALRTCRVCGNAADRIDLSGFRWREIAVELRTADARPER